MLATQDIRGGEARGASPDDDDGRRHGTRRWPCRSGRPGPSFSDVGQIADSLYAPTLNRIERWGTHRLAGGQAEAGVVPWAPDGVADDKPVDQRAMIVRAVWTNGKHRIARSNEQHLFLIDPPKDLPAVRKIPDRESASEIGHRTRRIGHWGNSIGERPRSRDCSHSTNARGEYLRYQGVGDTLVRLIQRRRACGELASSHVR
jgi:hypothetical protein